MKVFLKIIWDLIDYFLISNYRYNSNYENYHFVSKILIIAFWLIVIFIIFKIIL